MHDTKIPTVASYRRFPELRFRSLTGGTAVIDAYFSKKKPVIWNLATSLFSSFRTSTSITQERLPLLTSRATARRVFPEPGRMNETRRAHGDTFVSVRVGCPCKSHIRKCEQGAALNRMDRVE
ncbi:MAG: hypothetical protein V8T87_16775 [Victivallales bacterium]